MKLKDIDIDVNTYAEVWVKENQVSIVVWKKRLENCWEIYRTLRFHFSFMFTISTISYSDIVVLGELFEKRNGTPHTKRIRLSKLKKYLFALMESEWILDTECKFRGFDEEQKPVFTKRCKGYISIEGGKDGK